MDTIKGMATGNGGKIVTVNGESFEVLCPQTSGHRANIIVAYVAEGHRKVTVSFYNDKGSVGFEVYRFNSHSELQHYWSRNYRMKLPTKYAALGEKLIKAHSIVFG